MRAFLIILFSTIVVSRKSLILKNLILFGPKYLQNSKIILERVVYNSEPSNANVSAQVWQKGGHSYLNVSAETFKDLDRMILNFDFAIGKNEDDNNYENVLPRSTFSTCKIDRGVRGNFLVKIAMEDFEKTADFKFSCPFPKVNLFKSQ